MFDDADLDWFCFVISQGDFERFVYPGRRRAGNTIRGWDCDRQAGGGINAGTIWAGNINYN